MGADWTDEIKGRSLYIWYKMYQKSGLSQDKEQTPNATADTEEESLILQESNDKNNGSIITTVTEEDFAVQEFQDKEKTPNVIIDVEQGLNLEEEWENLIIFEANDTLPENIFEIEPSFKNTKTEVEVIVDSKENVDKDNIVEKRKIIDVECRKEIIKELKQTLEKHIYTTEENTINKAEKMDNRKHSRVLPGVVIPSPVKNSLFWPAPIKKIK